jgi:hypothetical protein
MGCIAGDAAAESIPGVMRDRAEGCCSREERTGEVEMGTCGGLGGVESSWASELRGL